MKFLEEYCLFDSIYSFLSCVFHADLSIIPEIIVYYVVAFLGLEDLPFWYVLLFLTYYYEGLFSTGNNPFVIMRRRTDLPNAPWESHYFLLDSRDNDRAHNYFLFYNSLFTSDGYFPESYATIPEFYAFNLGDRKRTLIGYSTFLKGLASDLSYFGPGFPKVIFRNEPYYNDLAAVDIDEDFLDLGPTLPSVSAEDSSEYLYTFERPTINFPMPFPTFTHFIHRNFMNIGFIQKIFIIIM